MSTTFSASLGRLGTKQTALYLIGIYSHLPSEYCVSASITALSITMSSSKVKKHPRPLNPDHDLLERLSSPSLLLIKGHGQGGRDSPWRKSSYFRIGAHMDSSFIARNPESVFLWHLLLATPSACPSPPSLKSSGTSLITFKHPWRSNLPRTGAFSSQTILLTFMVPHRRRHLSSLPAFLTAAPSCGIA